MHSLLKFLLITGFFIWFPTLSQAEEADSNWNRNDTDLPTGVQIAVEVSRNVAPDFYPEEGRYLSVVDLIVVPPFKFYGGEFYLQVTTAVTPEGGISSDYGDRTDYLLGYYWDTADESFSVDFAGGYSDLYQFEAAFYFLKVAKQWSLPWGEEHTFRLFAQAEVLDAEYESVQVGGDVYTLGGVYGWPNFFAGGDLTANFGVDEFSGEKSFFLGSGLDFILSDRWSVTIPQIRISEPLGDSEDLSVHSIGAAVLYAF